MVAGQCLDLSLAGQEPSEETVAAIHRLKTACLLTAPMEAGLILAGANEAQLAAGRSFGRLFGVAFQIQDDLLDLSGDEQALGKHTGKDLKEGKLTWPAVVGPARAREDAERMTDQACAALAGAFGEKASFLCGLARDCCERKN